MWMCLKQSWPAIKDRYGLTLSRSERPSESLHCLPIFLNHLSLMYYLTRRGRLRLSPSRRSFPFIFRTRTPSPFHQLRVYSPICVLRVLHRCIAKPHVYCIRLGRLVFWRSKSSRVPSRGNKVLSHHLPLIFVCLSLALSGPGTRDPRRLPLRRTTVAKSVTAKAMVSSRTGRR